MQKKHKSPPRAARRAVRRTKRFDVFQELRSYLRSQPRIVSLPAPPGTVSPSRWVSVRQASQWRREIARDRRAGKPLPDINREGVLTLRRFAEHEATKLNDICLADDLTLVRFVGVAESTDDFYYVCERLPPHAGNRRVYWSAVGECTSLRGRLDDDLYRRIDEIFRLNRCRPVRRMLILRKRSSRRFPGARVISSEPIKMTLDDLRQEVHGVLRGEGEGPRAPGKTRPK